MKSGTIFGGVVGAVILTCLLGLTQSGFPSRPNFQAVTINGVNVCQANGTNCLSAIVCTTACNVSTLAVGQTAVAYKIADTNRASTVTPALDPDLQFTNVPIGAYKYSALVYFNSPSSSQGFLMDMFYSGTIGAGNANTATVTGGYHGGACPSVTSEFAGVTTAHVGLLVCAASGGYIPFTEAPLLTTSIGTFGVDWSQNTSNATNVTMLTGAWITLTRLR